MTQIEKKESEMDSQWMSDLKAGDRFDVMNKQRGQWNVCKIVQVDEDKHMLYIHYEGWHKKYDEWIDINAAESSNTKRRQSRSKNGSNTLKMYAALNTFTPKCKYFRKPKKLHHTNRSTVLYQDGCFLMTANNDIDKVVYKYDISNEDHMRWIKIKSYPDGFKPINTGNILDGDILYIFGGKNGCFGKLNISTRKWDILCRDKTSDGDKFKEMRLKSILRPTMFWLNGNKHLHIFGNAIRQKTKSMTNYRHSFTESAVVSYHIKYDKDTNKCTEISNSQSTGYQHLKNAKIIYNKYLNQWISFCGKKDIFVCDLDKGDKNDSFEWKKMENIQLPMDTVRYCVVNVSEYLVLVLYVCDLWILDLKNNKWHKSKKQRPQMDQRTMAHIVNTGDGWLHFLGGNKYHFKLMIDDIVPNELHIQYTQIKELLITGYVKYVINKQYALFTSFNQDLIQIIKRFYPKFGVQLF